MSFDVKDVEYISKEEVPKQKRRTRWDDLFNSIPKGKAAVLTEDQTKPAAVRQALARRRKQGLLVNYSVVVTGVRGSRRIYVVNEGEE